MVPGTAYEDRQTPVPSSTDQRGGEALAEGAAPVWSLQTGPYGTPSAWFWSGFTISKIPFMAAHEL